MPDRIEYRAFTKTYERIVNKLITPVSIFPILTLDRIYNTSFAVRALWDTGATLSCLKPELFKRLRLRLFETTEQTSIAGIGGQKIDADLTFVNLFLAHNFVIEYCPVHIVDFPGKADVLIGMDTIRMGDFAVCNTGGKTSFSFTVPPFPDRVNFAEKAEAANRSGGR